MIDVTSYKVYTNESLTLVRPRPSRHCE